MTLPSPLLLDPGDACRHFSKSQKTIRFDQIRITNSPLSIWHKQPVNRSELRYILWDGYPIAIFYIIIVICTFLKKSIHRFDSHSQLCLCNLTLDQLPDRYTLLLLYPPTIPSRALRHSPQHMLGATGACMHGMACHCHGVMPIAKTAARQSI